MTDSFHKTSFRAIESVVTCEYLPSFRKSSFVASLTIYQPMMNLAKSYKEAMMHECWQEVMKKEIQVGTGSEDNKTWFLTELPEGKVPIG